MFSDEEKQRIVGPLIEKIGSKEERLRLGFLDETDSQEVAYTGAGFGYLLQVEAAGPGTLAEIYAAGYQHG
jgi:hypothetical protein